MTHRLLVDALRFPWAIAEEWAAIIPPILCRLILDEPMSAADREAVDRGRAAWRVRHNEGWLNGSYTITLVSPPARAYDDHDDAPPRAPEPLYARVAGQGFSGAVAVIGMYGVLSQRGGIDDTSTPMTSMSRLATSVQLAANDPAVAGIVLDVDSPGGSVYGCQELADAIFAAREAKPLAAVANSLMASAAYWTACQAGELYCAPGGEVGSIGVYTMHTNVAELMKQRGVAVEMISAGKYKTEGNPYGPLSDEARAAIQGSVDQYYDSFVRAVARGRGVSMKAVREGMGQGRILQGANALEQKMIDGVATLGQVIDKIGRRAKRGASARARMQREVDIESLS